MEIKKMIQKNEIEPAVITREQAARYINVKVGTLENWASSGKYNLPYIKIGKRKVLYKIKDLDDFLERQTIRFRNQ